MFPWVLRLKYWVNDFFHGSPMRKTLQEIKDVQTLKIGELKRYKEERLKELLTFAQKNCQFYSNYTSYNLSDYPVMDKSRYLENYDNFLVSPSLIPNQKEKLHIASTSGSTGTPFKVPQDTVCRTRRIAMIKYGNSLIGFKSFDLLMHLRSLKHHYAEKLGEIFYNKKLNIIYVDNANLDELKLSQICTCINKNRVKIIRGYMTTLDFITQYAVDNRIEFTHKPTFISVGELLNESLRVRVSEALGCRIISQYGNEECGIFGQTEINGRGDEIKLFNANHIVEILKMDSDLPCKIGELGRIVVTDLTNMAFPMIRYDIGDIAQIGDICEGQVLSIKKLCGRKQDLILKTDGERVDMFNSMPQSIFNNPSIRQWQFIQTDKSCYKLILASASSAFDESVIRAELRAILGNDATILIEFTNDIPVLSLGKRKSIINEYTAKR